MPTQIHRYSEPKAELLDGAIFVFAYGTNPEALAVVECRYEATNSTEWTFALAPLTTARLSAKLGGREIWKRRRLTGGPSFRETYVAFGRR